MEQGRPIQRIFWDHRISSTPIKPGFGVKYNFRGSSVSLHLRSGFRPKQRHPLWVHPVHAARSSDKGGEGEPDQSMSTNVFAGIIGFLVRFSKEVLRILSNEKKAFEKLEKKIEDAAEIVEEVAKFTEEIAEKVEGLSREDGVVHKIAERVDKESEIVENEVENVKKVIKAIDEKMDSAEHALEQIGATSHSS